MPAQQTFPYIIRCFRIPEQIPVLDIYHAFTYQKVNIEYLTPLTFPDQYHRQRFDLAQREIMKLETQFGRHLGIGVLLMRQSNIQADRFGARLDLMLPHRLSESI
jgi:hypothetical protein